MYRRKAKGFAEYIDFYVIDLLCLQLAFCIASIMRHGMVNPYINVLYRNTAIVMVLIQGVVVLAFNIFHQVLKRGYYLEFLNTTKTVCLVMLFVAFYLFAIQQGENFSRFVLLATGLFYWAFSYLARGIWKYFLVSRRRENIGKKSLIIITNLDKVKTVIQFVQLGSVEEYQITGIILADVNMTGKKICGIPVVASREDAATFLCHDWVDEIFWDLSYNDPSYQQLFQILLEMSIVVHMKIGYTTEFPDKKKYLQDIGDYTVVTMSSNIMNTKEAFIKRSFDVFGGMVGCLATIFLFIVLAPVIYIKSPGPILFSQPRVGRNGKIFKIFKFRSMYPDAEHRKSELQKQNKIADGMMFKIENDPRIIGSEKGKGKGIGNFIRKYSLDEFPQFWNVLKGEMSLVGTRPPTLDEWEKYDFYHRGRLSTKPGITGLWQVSGRSNITDFDEVVALDMKYIQNWNIGLDIKIMLKTMVAVVKKDGAG